MRPVGALIAILIALVMVLAGCLQIPGSIDDADESDTQDSGGSDESGGDSQQSGGEAPPKDGNEQNDDGDDGNGGNGDDGNETDKECHEHDPPKPAHPKDHQVDSTNKLRCPGNYVILDEGSGTTWNAPTWEIGDWWLYEMRTMYPSEQCGYQFRETVVGEAVHMDVPVYQIRVDNFDCDGEPQGESRTMNRTKDSFMQLSNNGFIQHKLIFPLVDDKSWKFRNQARDEDRQIVDVSLSHRSSFFFDGSFHETWRITMKWAGLERTIWWDVDAQHILRDEIWSGAIHATRTDLIDHHAADEDPGVLPLPRG